MTKGPPPPLVDVQILSCVLTPAVALKTKSFPKFLCAPSRALPSSSCWLTVDMLMLPPPLFVYCTPLGVTCLVSKIYPSLVTDPWMYNQSNRLYFIVKPAVNRLRLVLFRSSYAIKYGFSK